VTQLDSDLFIIDQHASDEKANFEVLSQKKIANQKLTIPQNLSYSADKEEMLLQNDHVLRMNGFDVEMDNTDGLKGKMKLMTVPVLEGITLGVDELDELLFLLTDAPDKLICRSEQGPLCP